SFNSPTGSRRCASCGGEPRLGSSCLELSNDFGGSDRRADFCEQPMRLAELALVVRLVAAEPRQLGALDVEEGLVALRARHLEPGGGFRERGLDVPRSLKPQGLTESAASSEQSRELRESGAEPPADGDRFVCELQSLCAIAESEMRCRHHREHGTLGHRKPSFPSNRQRLPQDF